MATAKGLPPGVYRDAKEDVYVIDLGSNWWKMTKMGLSPMWVRPGHHDFQKIGDLPLL